MSTDAKAVIVTGAAQGIGRSIAERFLADGAGVIVFDLDSDMAQATADALGPADRVRAIGGDVSSRSDVHAAVELCQTTFGRVDSIIAHAGIADVKPLLEIDDDGWQRIIDVNLTGVFLCIQEAGRAIAAGGRGGAIVVTASTNAFWVEQNMAPTTPPRAGWSRWCHGRTRSGRVRDQSQLRRTRRGAHAHLRVGHRRPGAGAGLPQEDPSGTVWRNH